ncbi:MAG: hypothetical protein ACK4Z6_07415, partial [Candidatus Methylomirabilales bacterium]
MGKMKKVGTFGLLTLALVLAHSDLRGEGVFGPLINLSVTPAGFSAFAKVAASGSNVYFVWQDNT